MKKFSSVFYMWFGFGFALAAVLAMFLPFIKVSGDMKAATYFFFDYDILFKGAWPSFAGFMLMLVSGLTMGVIALPFVSLTSKLEKILLIASAISLALGLVLVGLIGVFYFGFNLDAGLIIEYYSIGYYLALIFSGFSLATNIIALKLDW